MPAAAIPHSLLDLSPITAGGSAAESFANTRDLAQHAERLGYRRYWLAEHHGMPGIASAATSLVIAHVAQATKSIRVGAGGIMLPNHAPLVIAEQFGTLATLYPDRIDLGLGRAPGSDQKVARALRRGAHSSPDDFPDDVIELQNYFQPPENYDGVRAVPGEGLRVPVWILGSSLYGAQLAAAMGLPYAFASHFAPAQLLSAFELYRARFRAAAASGIAKPYAMPCFNVIAAETDAEAHELASSVQQAFINLATRGPLPLPAPVANYTQTLSSREWQIINQMLRYTAVGSPESIEAQLTQFLELTGADELMITAPIYDHAARLRSIEITAEAMRSLQTRADFRAGPPDRPASAERVARAHQSTQ